jgi:hypothetical protein
VLSLRQIFVGILALLLVQGTLEMALGIPTIVTRFVAETLILLLFVIGCARQVGIRRRPLLVPGIRPMLLLTGAIATSYAMNKPALLPAILFARHLLVFYVFFLALMNLEWSQSTGNAVMRFLVVMIVLQLVAGIEKLFRRGIEEGGGIGTMSAQAGSLSTIFPLFVIAFLTALFLYKNEKKYLLLMPVFMAFGVLNQKRALVFLVPFLMLLQYAVFRLSSGASVVAPAWTGRVMRRVGGFRMILGVVMIAALGVYIAGRTLRSLNPDSRFGGRFDFGYMLRTVVEYETYVFSGAVALEEVGYAAENLTFGRVVSTVSTFTTLATEGVGTFAFGRGPGTLIESALIEGTQHEAYLRIGIVAGKTGVVWLMQQIGLVGTFAMLWFYWQMVARLARQHRTLRDPTERAFALGLIGVTAVFIGDFAGYSTATLVTGTVTPVYFFLLAYCFKHIESPATAPATRWAQPPRHEAVPRLLPS